jgi:hypothetical protein
VAHLGFAARRQPTLSAVRPFEEVAPLLVLSYADLVSHDGEQARYLHRDPARNYTGREYLGAKGEPECVSEDVQARLSAQGRRRDAERIRDAWLRAHGTIDAALAAFSYEVGSAVGKPVTSATRTVARAADRVDRRLDEQLGL